MDNEEDFLFLRGYSGLVNGYFEFKFDFDDVNEIKYNLRVVMKGVWYRIVNLRLDLEEKWV